MNTVNTLKFPLAGLNEVELKIDHQIETNKKAIESLDKEFKAKFYLYEDKSAFDAKYTQKLIKRWLEKLVELKEKIVLARCDLSGAD